VALDAPVTLHRSNRLASDTPVLYHRCNGLSNAQARGEMQSSTGYTGGTTLRHRCKKLSCTREHDKLARRLSSTPDEPVVHRSEALV
jgi:hypothetical protein